MPRCTVTNLNGTQCRHNATYLLALNGEDVHVCTRHRTLTAAEYLNRTIVDDPIAPFLAILNRNQAILREDQRLRAHPGRVAPQALRNRQATLRDFIDNRENVHTTGLVNAQRPILDTLVQPYRNANEIPSLEEVMQLHKNQLRLAAQMAAQTNGKGVFSRMKQFFLNCFANSTGKELETFVWRHIFPLTRIHQSYSLRTWWMDGSAASIDTVQLFRIVLACICSIRTRDEYRPILLSRLMEELQEGRRVCSHGMCARLLNVFAGFEEVVLGISPVDPRSLPEKLGAAFAVLREKDEAPARMRQEGLEILLQHGVIDTAKQAEWLEAL